MCVCVCGGGGVQGGGGGAGSYNTPDSDFVEHFNVVLFNDFVEYVHVGMTHCVNKEFAISLSINLHCIF